MISCAVDFSAAPRPRPPPRLPPPAPRNHPRPPPPGALPEPEFLSACTRCGECITACPHGAVRMADSRFREAAGTPMVSPFDAPCRMCADTPCITACKPHALLRLPGAGLPAMGLAAIQTHNCLAHQGTTCTACSERCPIPDAIRLTAGKPSVDPRICTGCGVCQHVCPAPNNAVLLMPSLRVPGSRPHG
ncbi:MAG: 4Fe-4S binding protein [Kiritimatiellia bacterium]